MSKITYTDKQFLYENAPIPAIQKVEDTDLNNIKGAINQNGAYTPTTFSNNQYSCTLTGTLSAGDVIQVQLDLSNQNAGTDSDISISVDGGSSYYTLINGTLNIKASYYNFKNTYLKAVFDGTNFIEINSSNPIHVPISITNSTSNYSYYDLKTGIGYIYADMQGADVSQGVVTIGTCSVSPIISTALSYYRGSSTSIQVLLNTDGDIRVYSSASGKLPIMYIAGTFQINN